MKPTLISVSVLIGLIFPTAALHAAPQAHGKMAMRDVATHDQLSSKLRMARQKDPMKQLGPPAGKHEEDPSLKTSSRDLVKESTVICFNGNLTLVPKRAVIFIPEHLENRIGVKPKQKIKRWSEFYPANRGWIRTFEVSRDQALGYAPIPKSTLEAMQQGSSMVVATFKAGPISVLPLKSEEELEALKEEGVIEEPTENSDQ